MTLSLLLIRKRLSWRKEAGSSARGHAGATELLLKEMTDVEREHDCDWEPATNLESFALHKTHDMNGLAQLVRWS
jgi:hypothetical protein